MLDAIITPHHITLALMPLPEQLLDFNLNVKEFDSQLFKTSIENNPKPTKYDFVCSYKKVSLRYTCPTNVRACDILDMTDGLRGARLKQIDGFQLAHSQQLAR